MSNRNPTTALERDVWAASFTHGLGLAGNRSAQAATWAAEEADAAIGALRYARPELALEECSSSIPAREIASLIRCAKVYGKLSTINDAEVVEQWLRSE